MILVETLDNLVRHCLHDCVRPGSGVGTVDTQDLAGRIAQHLAEHGVVIGGADGSRLPLPDKTPSQPEPHRPESGRYLPLVLQQDRDGHVRIFCDGRDCCWSWPLDLGSSAQTNGEAITNAVQHTTRRHGRVGPNHHH